MDRISELRKAWPELEDQQARLLLVQSYIGLWKEYPKASPKEMAGLMDKRTKALCNSTIQKIGELIQAQPKPGFDKRKYGNIDYKSL